MISPAGARDGGDATTCAVTAVAEALFGEAVPRSGAPETAGGRLRSSLAEEISRSAWADLLGRFIRALGSGVPADAPGSARTVGAALRPWSGAVVVRLPMSGAHVVLLLLQDVAARLLGRAAPPPERVSPPGGGLLPLTSVLRARRIHARVQLHPIELPLGALVELREGDILCTNHALDAALAVHVLDGASSVGEPIARAYVGRVGASRAFQLQGAAPDDAVSGASSKLGTTPDSRSRR